MRFVLAFILLISPGVHASGPKMPAGYQVISRKGFTLIVHDEVLKQQADRHQRKPLDVLDSELDDLRRVLNPKLFELVREVPFWVRWDSSLSAMPGAVAMYYGGGADSLSRLGKDPRMANAIEILSLKRIGELRPPGSKFQQIVTLHELAHAVHHRLLGFDSTEVKAAFQQAVDRKLYDSVVDRFGRKGRAYARTNEMEYFAEISCAYLDTCHYYPFTFADLKEHDPAGFALAESVWKRPDQFTGRQPAIVVAKFTMPEAIVGPPAPPRSSAKLERDAFVKLDQGLALRREGKVAQARIVFELVIKSYPGTVAAADAARTLEQLR